MNRNYISLIVVLILTIGLGGYVYTSNLNKEANAITTIDLIPEGFTYQIIEISSPNQNLEELYNANLIWKEINENSDLKKIENFWKNGDSSFNELKGESIKLVHFEDEINNDFFILEFENNIEEIKVEGWQSKVINKLVLFTKNGNFNSFSFSNKNIESLKNEDGFLAIYNSKGNSRDKINVFRKKNDNWSIFELVFLPEQIFTNGFDKNELEQQELNSDLDVSIFSKIPLEFKSIELIHFDEGNQIPKDTNYIKAKNKECKCDIQFDAYDWMESPAVFFQSQFQNASYALFKLKSVSGFKDNLNSLLNDSLGLMGENDNGVVRPFNNSFDYNSIFKSNMRFNYFLRMDDYVYFAEDKLDLDRIIFQITSKLTIDKSEEISAFLTENINKKSFKVNITGGINNWDFDLKSGVGIVQSHAESKELLYKSMLYTNEINLNGGKTNPKWKLDFGTALNASIFVVKNHRTKDKDYLVQDRNNVLYFVSPNGKIKWKTILDNPIVGKIKNIDILGNNKYQLIFNTYSKLYILDVLGRNVKNFPVTILDNATANVTILDYDKDLNFRFLIPTTKGIKSIDKNGNIVKGWLQPSQSSKVNSDISHLLINNLDYIVVQDSQGLLYFYNRKGEERYAVKSKFNNDIHILHGSSIDRTRAIYLDSATNSIKRQFFSDAQTSVLLSPDKKINSFFFLDYNMDKDKDFILVFEDEIKIYNQDLSIQMIMSLPAKVHQVKFWSNGYGFINQFEELTIYQNEEFKIVDGAKEYRIDSYKKKTRIVVKGENNLKLLHF